MENRVLYSGRKWGEGQASQTSYKGGKGETDEGGE